MIYTNNKLLLDKALKNIPLASQTYSKSYRYFTGLEAPHFIERGKGAKVWDVDNNMFTDFICALGPITVGYCNNEINEVIMKQLEKGIVFSKASPLEYELSKLIKEKLPFAEMVRYLKNGSDVTTTAVRLARAYTGKDRILVCGYHGIHDWYIGATKNNLGVPKVVCELTTTFDYNSMESLEAVVDKYDDIAAVIMEPIQGDGPLEGYLQDVRRLTEREGIVLIFDEVVSGFRYAAGGASEYYSVSPDLITFGKGMANGMPISVIAGKKALLEMIETKNVFISTTFGGECLSLAAAIKTIEILDRDNGYEHMWALGDMFLKHARNSVKRYGLHNIVNVSGLAPHCGIGFDDYDKYSYLDFLSVYIKTLLEHNIMSVGINNFSLAHTKDDVANLNNAVDDAFGRIRKNIDNGNVMIEKQFLVDPVFKR